MTCSVTCIAAWSNPRFSAEVGRSAPSLVASCGYQDRPRAVRTPIVVELANGDRYFAHSNGSGAVQLAVEVDEPPFAGPGLKPLAPSKKHGGHAGCSSRVAVRGMCGNRRAALPLAREGGSTT
jgi:hypothetical protein